MKECFIPVDIEATGPTPGQYGMYELGACVVDMKAYFMGRTGCRWENATLATMAKFTGVPFTALPHRAVENARIQGAVFAKLIER